MADRTAPQSQLRLEWVYGYRGHQTRSNLVYNKQGDVIYFVAGVGIVYNDKEHKQKFFLEHDDDIMSLTLHPDKVHVATGQVGKSPQIIVWDSTTIKPTSILKGGHKEGVILLDFSANGERLVSCGMDTDSTIAIWSWKKGLMLTKSTGHLERIFDLKFKPDSDTSFMSCGKDQLNFWTVTGNTMKKKKGLFGNTKNVTTMFCMCVSSSDKELLYTGTITGQIYVWKNNELKEILPNVHKSSIFQIARFNNGYATAGKDGTIRTWNAKFEELEVIPLAPIMATKSEVDYSFTSDIVIRSLFTYKKKLLIGTQSSEIFELDLEKESDIDIKCFCKGHGQGELWALSPSPIDTNIVATASDDKTVRIWDLHQKKLLKFKLLPASIRSCAFSNDAKQLACGLTDGKLIVLNCVDEDMKVVHEEKNKFSEVLHEMKYSPDGQYLAVGSNDTTVYILSTQNYKKIVAKFTKNSSSITHLDWSKDSKYVLTNSADGANLVFQADKGDKGQLGKREEIKKIEWNSFTGVLGDEVNGIWEKYADKTDINASDANFEDQVIVTGDDFGLVKLFRFPSVKKGAKFRKYVGHSSHVTNVCFTSKKDRVISIGGADHGIFQWRFVPEGGEKTPRGTLDREQSIVEDDLPDKYDGYLDTNSEDSDSDLSGREVDSDMEHEKEITYDRKIYKDDLITLKPIIKREIKEAQAHVKRQARPDISLGIEFVFGYRGYDCRDNLFYIPQTDEIVYHVAALGIVYNKKTGVQRFYDQHTDDILCLSVHPDGNHVATGQTGRDPDIHVWNVITMNTISVLKGGHAVGVCSLGFSADGIKLASVDAVPQRPTICVWKWKRGEKLGSTRSNESIFCIKWNPHNDQIVTVGLKHIKFWNQVGGGFTSNRGLFGKLSGVETQLCVAFGKQENRCYSGGATGSIFVWDDKKLVNMIPAHQGPVFAIFANEQYEAYATGGKDGKIIIWNGQFTKIFEYDLKVSSMNTKGLLLKQKATIRAICVGSSKILVGTNNGEIIDIDKGGNLGIVIQGHGEGELWGLSTHPKKQFECCTVSDDCTLRLWNVSPEDRYMINGRLFDKPGRACQYSPDGKIIAVGFKDGTVHILNADTLKDIEVVRHRKEEISDIKFSPVTGKYVAVGSHDNFIDIYSVDTRKRLGICKDASSYITHIEWNDEGRLLMINSGAKEILYYECPRGNRVNIREEQLKELNWSTFTSVLGPTCSGIWQPCTDVTDINTSCLSSDQGTLATGDDFGMVKLFKYPCPGKFSKFKKYNGHSAHVTNVRWTNTDSKLLSIGGGDTSLIIWNNEAYSAEGDTAKSEHNSVGSKIQSTVASEMVLRNSRKGESDDSDTDSENEGYDSDVGREFNIDYQVNIFETQIKRPTTDAVKNMYNVVTKEKKKESSKPSRYVKNKYTRTKINKMKRKQDEKEVDPMALMHVLSKLTLAGEAQKTNTANCKDEIETLNLSHIHGYRGFDCRDNVFYVQNGKSIIYHAASVGIVVDLETGHQSFYMDHTDDIISLCVNSNSKYKNVVATGQIGKGSEIHVWNAESKEVLSILIPLTKSDAGICSLSFSDGGKLLVSVGLDDNYTVTVWRWKEGTCVATATGDTKPNRLFKAMFRPESESAIVSVGFKHISFWNVAGSQLLKRKGVLSRDANVSEATDQKKLKRPIMLSVAFGPDDITYTGGMTGDIYIWKENVLLKIINGHNGPIFTMFTTSSDGYIVTGSKEKTIHNKKDPGPIKVWSRDMKKVIKVYNLTNDMDVVKSVCRYRNKIIVGTKRSQIFEIDEKTAVVKNIVEGHSEGELWGLAVHPSKDIFCTVSYDGYLKIWGIKSKKMMGSYATGGEMHSCSFNRNGDQIVIGSKDGTIVLLKCNSEYNQFEKLDGKRQKNAIVQDLKFYMGPNESKNLLVAGYNDCSLDIFEVTEDHTLYRVGYCSQVPGPVLQIDWETQGNFIKVGTTDYKTVVYDVPKGDTQDDENKEWYEWTSIFDPQIIGIWPSDHSKSNYFNCAHLANHAYKLATGDDDGSVKLFPFPCTETSAPIDVKYGHSSFVTNLKFLNNNTHLMSIGGLDYCVFVWECN